MSAVEVTCNCGWTLKSNDKDAVAAATRAHDDICALRFKPDKISDDPNADCLYPADSVADASNRSTDVTPAAGLLKAIDDLAAARDDLVILVAYMASEDYTAEDIVYAVERPWKYADVLADAKAALEAEVSS